MTIPDSVTSIGNSAFNWCKSLTDVYFSGTEEEWNAIEIGDYNDELLNATIHFGSTAGNDPLCGDVDFDGVVTLLDVVLLNKNLMIGTALSPQGRANADTNRDGRLEPTDSLNILKYCINLLPSLPTE